MFSQGKDDVRPFWLVLWASQTHTYLTETYILKLSTTGAVITSVLLSAELDQRHSAHRLAYKFYQQREVES